MDIRSIKIIAFIFSSFVFFNASSQELPCQAYFKKEEGGRCMERYKEDENGEKHGKYIRYGYGVATLLLSNDYIVLEIGNYVHGKQQGNWKGYETSLAGLWAHDRYVWYENGKPIVTSETPIKSYADALEIKKREDAAEKEQADKKESEQKRKQDSLQMVREKEELIRKENELVRQKREKEENEKAVLDLIEWAYSNEPCLFIEVAPKDDARRSDATEKCERRKLENIAFMDADNSLIYKTFRYYDGEKPAYNSKVILLQGSLSYFGMLDPSVNHDNDRENITKILMKINGYTKYLRDFPEGYKADAAKEIIQDLRKDEEKWINNAGSNYYSCVAEIKDNTLLNTTEGYKTALVWWEILKRIDAVSDERSFSRWKVKLLSGYVIMSKWALKDIDGAAAIYRDYKDIKVPTHEGRRNYFQDVGLPEQVSLGKALWVGDASVDYLKYSKYFKLVYEKVTEKITLPDAKANYKKITAE